MSYYTPADIDEIVERLGIDGKMFQGASIVASGCAGFLGRYLVTVLKRLGAAKIIVLDNLVTTGPFGEAFVKDLADDPVIRYMNLDVSTVWKWGYDVPITHVIHAAGLTSPFYYKKFPLETLEVSVAGTRNMLDLAREKGARVLHFSTSETYGDPDAAHVPTREDYRGNANTMGPRAPYDEAKRLSETLCWIYHTHYAVPVVVVRPFNVYGPGMWEQDYRCMPNFAARLKARKPLQVYATGRQTRTFSYVTDATVGFLQALAKGKAGEAFNIGSPAPEITILELAEMMGLAAQRKPTIEIVPHPDDYPGDEPQRRCPDITKAREDLRFNPVVPLGEGLRRFIQWTEENYTGGSDGR